MWLYTEDVEFPQSLAQPNTLHNFLSTISRMLSQSTSTDILDQIIATSPTTPEFYRTRGVVKCFKEEFAGALRDFKSALAHAKHRKRVSNVFLGKKPTLPLHNHHGNEDDECTGTESQLYFLRAACYLQYAISLVDKAIQKVDGVERRDGEGSELRLVAVKKGIINGSSPKFEEYRKELFPIMYQVQNLAKRSVRDYTHFLGFYPSSLPTFSATNGEGTSKASTPVTSRDSSPVRSFKDRDDSSCQASLTEYHGDTDRNCKIPEKVTGVATDIGNVYANGPATMSKDNNHRNNNYHHHFHGYQPSHTFATYHPLLIEAWYAIALNYVLLGDLHTGALWHARISEMHEFIEGYPVFLPARSMAQADYMEVLERIKKSNSLSQHEKLKEFVEVVKQKEKEREEKEREWVEKHHHKMLLTAAENESKDTVDLKRIGVKIGKKSKSVTQSKNGNAVTPVIGIDGQRHHPCCPLAPGNHVSPKDRNHNHNHSPSSGSSDASSNSTGANGSGNSGGPRQYPLHTQRADSVMMWLRAVILRTEKESDAKINEETKPVDTKVGKKKPNETEENGEYNSSEANAPETNESNEI
ncbi:7051_t:CDS:1 [Acaulospora colombiana]|uniref:7051_t:CDS:1 n=1 Tax=Acaulospora colombiana TaxID=27376 RepID=A0ACA9LJZ7_9GLOM|nr:7051_t:CDS:1 [Acaulospora colombiana]